MINLTSGLNYIYLSLEEISQTGISGSTYDFYLKGPTNTGFTFQATDIAIFNSRYQQFSIILSGSNENLIDPTGITLTIESGFYDYTVYYSGITCEYGRFKVENPLYSSITKVIKEWSPTKRYLKK